MEEKDQLLEISKLDIKAAKILLENKLYLQSIYNYQQCVEKISKYIGIRIGVTTFGTMRDDIGHYMIKVYEAFLSGKTTKEINCKGIIDSVNTQSDKAIADLIINFINNEKEKFHNPNKKPIVSIDFNKTSSDQGNIIRTLLKNQEKGLYTFKLLYLNAYLCHKYTIDTYRYPTDKIKNPITHFSIENDIIVNLHFFIETIEEILEDINTIIWELQAQNK